MDDSLPNPKPFNPPAPSSPIGSPPATNPYDTEIPTESVEHTPETPTPPQNVSTSPETSRNWEQPEPPTAEQARSNDLPHKPHHFATKNAVILGVLFLITAALSSVVTFALVNSHSEKAAPVQQAPVSKISPTPDPTATWQTFTDIMGTYTLKYPLEYQIYNPANTTTILGTTEQIALYKETELNPSSTNKPSTLAIQILPSQTYTQDPTAVIESVTLDGKEFSKMTTTDTTGASTVEYVYSDTDHLYRMAYVKGVNDDNFEKIIQTFAFTAPAAITTPSGSMTACTMDARVCPDGSSVGRIPPSCEFAACP